MNKHLRLLLLLTFSCVFFSCSLEEDDEPEVLTVAFAKVDNPGGRSKFHLILDDDKRLYTAETGDLVFPDLGYPQDGKRVFVSYNVLEPASANEIKLKNLLYVPISSIATENSSGRNDRHQLEMLYVGADYLNVLLSNVLPVSDSNSDVLLVEKGYEEATNSLYFDLIYSNGGETGYGSTMIPVCFDLSSLKEVYQNQNEVNLVISTYEKDGENPKLYTGKYKWQ